MTIIHSGLQIARKILGVLLLLIPFVSLTFVFGELGESRQSVPPFQWALSVFICFSVGWILQACFPGGIAWVWRKLSVLYRLPVAVFLALIGAECVVISSVAFDRVPMLVDSVIQSFQAKFFVNGVLAVPAPKLSAFFMTQHMVWVDGLWFSQYPPGHSMFLAFGELLGAQWLIAAFLTVGSSFLIYKLTAKHFGESVGKTSLLLMTLCPFLLFMGSSYMNHVSCLFFLSGAFYFYLDWTEACRRRDFVLCAACLGGAAICRPLTALCILLVFALFGCREIFRKKDILSVVSGLLAFLAMLSFYFIYNWQTTGDPLLPGYIKLWGAGHELGFHESPWGKQHTPLRGAANELLNLQLLEMFLFESLLPSLWPMALFFLFRDKLSVKEWLLVAGFCCLPSAYFFYWHNDSFLGPRFLYSSLIFIIPLTALGFHFLYEWAESAQKDEGYSRLWSGPLPFFKVVLLISVGFTVGGGYPSRFTIYQSGLPSFKYDIAGQAKAQGLTNAIVFIPVSWGNRIIARLTGLDLDAALIQKAYNFVDHCDLYRLMAAYESEQPGKGVLVHELNHLIAKKEKLGGVAGAEDHTIRVRTNSRLDPSCIEELTYDTQGFELYTPHLRHNSPFLDGEVIYARDLRGENQKLLALYPGRKGYLYRDGKFIELK